MIHMQASRPGHHRVAPLPGRYRAKLLDELGQPRCRFRPSRFAARIVRTGATLASNSLLTRT